MILTDGAKTKLSGKAKELIYDFAHIVESFAMDKDFSKAIKGGREGLKELFHKIIDDAFDDIESDDDEDECDENAYQGGPKEFFDALKEILELIEKKKDE